MLILQLPPHLKHLFPDLFRIIIITPADDIQGIRNPLFASFSNTICQNPISNSFICGYGRLYTFRPFLLQPAFIAFIKIHQAKQGFYIIIPGRDLLIFNPIDEIPVICRNAALEYFCPVLVSYARTKSEQQVQESHNESFLSKVNT